MISTLRELDLAKCDKFGGCLLEIGELIRDKFEGSYLGFLESLEEKPKIWWRRIKKWHKALIWTLGGIIMLLSVAELGFGLIDRLKEYRQRKEPRPNTEQLGTLDDISPKTDSLSNLFNALR